MKLRGHILSIALAAVALPLASFAAENSRTDTNRSEPAKSLLDHYVAIQEELAKDSMKGVNEHATAIAKLAKSDEAKSLPPAIAGQAEKLAGSKDLKSARQAFKPLSASLVKYVSDNKAAKGTYHEAYCPMAKASWLQTGKDIRNPYYGKSMLDCGELKN